MAEPHSIPSSSIKPKIEFTKDSYDQFLNFFVLHPYREEILIRINNELYQIVIQDSSREYPKNPKIKEIDTNNESITYEITEVRNKNIYIELELILNPFPLLLEENPDLLLNMAHYFDEFK